MRDVQVSPLQVRLQPPGQGPGLLLLRRRRLQGGNIQQIICSNDSLPMIRTACVSPASPQAALVTPSLLTQTPAVPGARPVTSASVSVSYHHYHYHFHHHYEIMMPMNIAEYFSLMTPRQYRIS